jgi:hypothetical protein
LVYTVGTLITAPASLNVVAALIGLAAILLLAGLVIVQILKVNKTKNT